ncbi:expressed unknown protein [Seminavis robusta]|uniref:Uncharacterized protein n=1 Tax=Seminavis robusta TaxID=568900 RepID=A0A9N8DKR7_9STRA|nr:expressed unknown protein [Seminavis robusta]|eukprot:Sro134_g063400.1 n/a (542) ;mRNA; r:31504-33436
MHHTNNTTSKHDGSIAPDDPGAFGPGSNTTTGTASTTTEGDEEGEGGDLEPPLFRSVAIQPAFAAAFAASKGSPETKQPSSFGPASKSFFGQAVKSPVFNKAPPGASKKTTPRSRSTSPVPRDRVLCHWKAQAMDGVYVLPCYYPRCDRRSATSDQSVDSVLERLFCCFKKLNIQATYEPSFATFGLVLRTPEQVELSLLIWFACKSRASVYVELDKRQSGCGCGPLKYICRILKAIKCCNAELEGDSLCLAKHQELRRGSVEMSERCRKMSLLVASCAAPAGDKKAPAFFKAAPAVPFASFTCVGDQTVNSLEMVWGLLKTPVTWSHGLELLGTVSDPNKSGIESSKAVSKVILLGVSPMAYGEVCCRGIHEKLVHMMQSLVGDSSSSEVEHLSAYQRDCLLQLVLTCLVNAMEVHIKFVAEESESMEVTMEDGTTEASVMSRFLESTKGVVACDIVEVLVTIVSRANTKPHHAYLAVKALFLLSSENSSVRQYVSMAMAAEDKAQRSAALKDAHEVGVQSHGLLEAECERLQRVLQTRH